MTFRPTHDVGPRTQCISGLNYAAYGLPVNASRLVTPGPRITRFRLAADLGRMDWIPTGFRTRFRRSHHGILSPLTGFPGTRVVARIVLARTMPTDRISLADAI